LRQEIKWVSKIFSHLSRSAKQNAGRNSPVRYAAKYIYEVFGGTPEFQDAPGLMQHMDVLKLIVWSLEFNGSELQTPNYKLI
jgi:hypothetical protein